MYFTYNGISSEDMGLKIISFPPPPKAEETITYTAIPGRETGLVKRKGQYSNTKPQLKFALLDRSRYRAILEWLSGSGQLIYSDEPDKYYNAYFTGSTDYERVSDEIIEASMKVTVLPFARAANPTIIDLTSATSYVLANNAGTVKGKPIITLKPSGTDPVTISINGEDFVVQIPGEVSTLGWSITIDSELQIAYYTRTNGDKVTCTEYTTGHFPLLHVGDNYIKHGGNVTRMEINMNERWY